MPGLESQGMVKLRGPQIDKLIFHILYSLVSMNQNIYCFMGFKNISRIIDDMYLLFKFKNVS